MEKKLWIEKKSCRVQAALLTVVLLILTGLAVMAEGAKTLYFPLLLFLAAAAGGYRLLKLEFRWVLNLISAAVIPFLSMWLLQWFTCKPERMYPMMILLNYIFFILFYMGLSFLAGSFRRGYGIASVLTLILGIANYFVVEFRSSPIVPWDLLSIGTAASVADNYTYTITWHFLSVVMGFVFLILTAGKMTLQPKKWRLRLPAFAVCLALLLFTGVSIQRKEVKDFFGMDQTLFTPNVRYRNNGFVAAFVGNLYLIHIEEPEGYSAGKVTEIVSSVSSQPGGGAWTDPEPEKNGGAASQDVEAGTAEGSSELPNIIVVMNEAFSDLSVLGDFQTNEDYMPFFHSLMDQYTSGHLMVSVKGGNTANTEYEFLSGDSMAFLPSGSVVYQQYIKDNVPSLPDHLKNLGYSTTAIHPYLGSGWDRNKVYPKLGFDQFLDINSFSNAEYVRDYVSDESAFDKIIEVFENREEGEKQFIFEVTMQNHSGYSKDFPGFSPTIQLTDFTKTSTSIQAAEKYLTLIQASDTAFEKLIAYFQQVEEPTVIIMFGDHQPSDYITNVISRVTGYDSEASLEEYQKSYLVPYVIWNNFGIEKDDSMELTSVNYLSSYLLKTLGLPLTQYQEFLLQLKEELPVICSGTYIDQNGVYHSWSEEDPVYGSLLNQYNILQYNHLIDGKHRVDEVFQ
ncbi:MAG: LTA synthase family protein [Lachnospiraceae bacterium]|nr:LTA synthase family protein [Lachnospiraceae bacterium]